MRRSRNETFFELLAFVGSVLKVDQRSQVPSCFLLLFIAISYLESTQKSLCFVENYVKLSDIKINRLDAENSG